ncbi:MAG: murein hydrolase activator EnvC family protein [Anaerovoracaceae bacterium]
MKRIFAVLVAVVLVFSVSFTAMPSYEAHADLRDQLSSGQKQVATLKKKLKTLQSEVDKANEQLASLNEKIADTNTKISSLNAQIKTKKEEVDTSEASLESRLRAMYKSGTVGFIEILFSSEDAEDLISNAMMLHKIYENDQQVVSDLEKQYDSLKSDQKELKQLQADLITEKEKAAAKKEELDSKKEKLNSSIAILNATNANLIQELHESESDANQLGSGGDTGGTYSGGTFLWPCASHTVSCEYGPRFCPIHQTDEIHSGIDISASYGTNIYAAASGTVTIASYQKSFGNCVRISHGSGLQTLYAHCSRLLVSPGQHVKRGQVIAKVGSTGDSTGPHLHFTVYKNGAPVNPRNYL